MDYTAYQPVSDSTFFRPPATEDLDTIHAMEAGFCSWCIFRTRVTCDIPFSTSLDMIMPGKHDEPLHPVHGHHCLATCRPGRRLTR
jgi:hypothetical protein